MKDIFVVYQFMLKSTSESIKLIILQNIIQNVFGAQKYTWNSSLFLTKWFIAFYGRVSASHKSNNNVKALKSFKQWIQILILTITLSHIFMWVFIPELLIIVIKAHKGENYLKEKNVKSWLQ